MKIGLADINFDITIDNNSEALQEVPPAATSQPIDKPVFRKSKVVHYFSCPKKYKLALDYGDEIETTMAMRQGLIFENFVLGNKPDHDTQDFKENVIGKITAPTMKHIKAQAEIVKEDFLDGQAYLKLRHETDDFIVTGELDYVGDIIYEGDALTCIADLKYTSNINELWNKKARKSDFLDAIFYTYLFQRNHGVMLPFLYKIVENTYVKPLVKDILIQVTENDFNWLERKLNEIENDYWFEPRVNENNCLGWKSFCKCQFLEFCTEGREFICEPLELEFSGLDE